MINYYKKYSFPDLKDKDFISNLKLYKTPESLIKKNVPKRLYMNIDLKDPLYSALSELQNDDIKTWDGLFNIRPIRGKENLVAALISMGKLERALKYMSAHSYGMAIDINAATNKMFTRGDMNPRIVKTFLKYGFEWGGNFTRLDPMHFQLII
jgi:hypothetical protein